ncbi:DUF86 domain-containing protein [Hymenobacter terrigena]
MSPKKDRPRDPDRARHMVEAAKLILAFTAGRTFNDLLTDLLFRSAVERQFEILGEASSHISSATQVLWPSIEWVRIKNFRNLLAHEYFRTDYAEVWNIVQNLLPALLPTLEQLFADLDRQFGPDARV